METLERGEWRQSSFLFLDLEAAGYMRTPFVESRSAAPLSSEPFSVCQLRETIAETNPIYSTSLRLCLWVGPDHTDAGLSHVTGFGQWDRSKCYTSRDLRGALHIGSCLLMLLLGTLQSPQCRWAWASLLDNERHGAKSSLLAQMTPSQPSDVWGRPSWIKRSRSCQVTTEISWAGPERKWPVRSQNREK